MDQCSTAELESLKLEISSRDSEIASLREHLTKLETSQSTKNKKRRFGDLDEAVMDDAAREDKKDENKRKPTVEHKQTETRTTRTLPIPNASTLIQEIQSAIEERFTEMKDFIEKSIDKKFQRNVGVDNTYASKVTTGLQTLSNEVTTNSGDTGV